MTYKLHIGYHKTGTTFLQKKIFEISKNFINRYDKSVDLENNVNKPSLDRCIDIINNLKKNTFYSNENFSKINIHTLIKMFKIKKLDILITLRKQNDLIISRYYHKPTDFYLENEIKNLVEHNKITKNIIEHYDFYNIIKILRDEGHTVTYVWYEDLFSLEEKSINVLANYLCVDKNALMIKISNNINNKINAQTIEKQKY